MTNSKIIDCYDNKTYSFSKEIITMHYSQAFELYRNNSDRVELWCNYFLEAIGNVNKNTFLDCGCGVGRFTLPMSQYFCETYGVDADKSMLKIAQEKSGEIKWIKADVRSIPLSNNTVDVTLASMLIEHLDTLNAFFSELHRIIKPNGVFLLRTMLPEDIENTTWYSFSQEAKQLELSRTRSYDEICKKLSESGFDIVKSSCRLNVTEKTSGNIVARLKSKSYEILHRLSRIEYLELLKNAAEWEEHSPANDVMSSSLLVFRKVR